MPDEIASFTPEVAEKLKTYVYRLIDPRNGETFYLTSAACRHIRGFIDR
jgi:hypothetical protein